MTEADARLVDGYAPCIVGIATTTTTPDGYTYPIAKARLMEYAVLGAPPTIEQETDVPINVSLVVYCSRNANIGAARERLLRRIGAGAKTDGGPAHFHPTAWPLGRPVVLADLIALLGADPTVSLVVSDPAMDPRVVFQTVSGRDNTADNIKAGRIRIGSNERARAGNDSFHPELGIVRLFVAAAK